MRGPAHLDHIKTGGASKPAKFHRRAERGHAPSRVTEPPTNATAHGPHAPPSQFADDKPSSRPQHAGHFHNGSLSIPNKAKHGHSEDIVESRVAERQSFCTPLNEPNV